MDDFLEMEYEDRTYVDDESLEYDDYDVDDEHDAELESEELF